MYHFKVYQMTVFSGFFFYYKLTRFILNEHKSMILTVTSVYFLMPPSPHAFCCLL